jgi:alkanesulfonate monooxygenase SsuD/methylene tetrahydromethanopterin reductase-like flavin-dependent oxidoreductase (luciferase family)
VLSISDDDPAAARREIGRWSRPILAVMADSPQVAAVPVARHLLTVAGDEQGGRVEDLPADLLAEFVAAGDSKSCRTAIDRLLEAGADRVVLVPNPAGFRSTASMVEQIRAASALTGGAGNPG